MRKVRVLALLLLLFSLMPISFSKGAWEYQDSYGSWEYYNTNSWKSPYNANYSWFEYKTNQTNLNRYSCVIRLKSYDIGGLWELEKAQQIVNFTFVDESNTHKLEVIIGHEIRIHLFGYKDVQTYVLISFDDVSEAILPIIRLMDVEIYVWRSSTDTLSVDYLMKYDYTQSEANQVFSYNYTVGSSWFNNVNITQRVEKQLYTLGSCNAMIEGEKLNEVVGSGSYLTEKPYSFTELPLAQQIGNEIWRVLKGVSDTIYNALPQEVKDFLSTASTVIYDFGNFAYTLLIALWDTLISNIPLVFGAYGLYLIYLIFKAMDEGDWSILFEHFIKITSLFLSLANAVLSVIRTVINLIKWW